MNKILINICNRTAKLINFYEIFSVLDKILQKIISKNTKKWANKIKMNKHMHDLTI